MSYKSKGSKSIPLEQGLRQENKNNDNIVL